MLEKFIASLLVPHLAKYVENIDPKQLSVDIWSGKATLNDLVLKTDVLDQLLAPNAADGSRQGSDAARFPLRIHRGLCKKVTLDIPLQRLRSQPVVLEIDEVFITLSGGFSELHAVSGDAVDKTKKWDRIATQKAQELDKFEVERKRQRDAAAAAAAEESEGGSGKKESSGGGYFTRLGEMVINNVIVKVNTVHVRFEDAHGKVAMGAVLGDVQLLTVDERTGEAVFTDPSKLQRMYKRLRFSGMQLYCDDPQLIAVNEKTGRSWYTQINDWQAWYHAMHQRVRDGDVARSTVLGPVTGSVDVLSVFKKFIPDLMATPYVTAMVNLQQVLARCSREQYVTLVRVVSTLTNWSDIREFLTMRPSVPVRGNTKAWWTYVLRAVRVIAGEPRRERLLRRISESCMTDYQVLYRDVVRKIPMSTEKLRTYRFVTRYMTVDDMVTCRKAVYAQIANEIQMKRRDNEVKVAEAMAQQQQRKQGWMSWFRGSQPTTPKEVQEDEAAFNDLQRDYGIDPNKSNEEEADLTAMSNQLPPSYSWLDLSFTLPIASYQLMMHDSRLTLSFYQLRGRLFVLNAKRSLQWYFGVQDLLLSNPMSDCDGGSLLSNLVEGISLAAPKAPTAAAGQGGDPGAARSPYYCVAEQRGGALQVKSPTLQEMLTEGTSDTLARGASDSGTDTAGNPLPLLSVAGAINPVDQLLPDTKLDLVLRVHMLPLRIVTDAYIIQAILAFFKVPPGANISSIAESARQTAAAVGTAASQEVQDTMSTVKGMFVSVDISAPVIILPKTLRASRAETALSISMGRIRFNTKPLTESEKQQRLALATDSEERHYFSNSATFGKFFVELTSLEDALSRPESGFMIIPQVGVAMDVLLRINDHDDSREKCVLRLRIPKLRLGLSRHQVYRLTDMIDTWASFRHYAKPMGTAVAVHGGVPQQSLAGQSTSSPRRVEGSAGSPVDARAASDTLLDRPRGDAAGAVASPTRVGLPGRVSTSPADNRPVLRLELLTMQFGVDVFEDDPDTHAVVAPPRFSLNFSSVEVLFAMRSVQSKMLLLFKQPCVSDRGDAENPILRCGAIQVDLKLVKGAPTTVGVDMESGVVVRLGSPCMDLMEVIMDVVNLVLLTMKTLDGAPQELPASAVPDESDSDSVVSAAHAREELAYQMGVIEQQNSEPDHRVANILIRVRGASQVVFLNRLRGQTADAEFFTASVDALDVTLLKNTVTMEVSGSVGKVTANIAACFGVQQQNSVLLQYDPSKHGAGTRTGDNTGSSTPVAQPPTSSTASEAPGAGGGSAARTDSHSDATPPHVAFSFRKGRPMMPLFEENAEGKRVLTNAAELRYSNVLDLELGASTVTVDMQTIMLLKTYFTVGFFSRLTSIADRPVYRGKAAAPPRSRGPRLLMGTRVVVRDTTIVLPVDARSGAESFEVVVGNVIVENNLNNAAATQSMGISLREIGFTRQQQHMLLPPRAFVDISVATSLDLERDDPTRVDLHVDGLDFSIRSKDLVDTCTLLRQNLLRMALEVQGMELAPPTAAPPAKKTAATPPPRTTELQLSLGVDKVNMRFCEEDAQSPRFGVESVGIHVQLMAPANHLQLHWRSFHILDVRDGTTSPLVLCDAGTVQYGSALTALSLLHRDFGVRPSALSSTAPDLLGPMTASEKDAARTAQPTSTGATAEGDGAAAAPTELLSMAVLSMEFTFRRLAISDQWLHIYDFVCNEKVLSALRATPTGSTTEDAAAATNPDATEAAVQAGDVLADATTTPPTLVKNVGFRCRVSTPSVTVPFLNISRDPFAEAHISDFFVDVITMPTMSCVAVKVRDVELVDCASRHPFVRKARVANSENDSFGGGAMDLPMHSTTSVSSPTHLGTTAGDGGGFGGSSSGAAFGTVNSITVAAAAAAEHLPEDNAPFSPSNYTADAGDVLNVVFKADPQAHKNRIVVAVGQLDVLCSMPLIYKLVDYCANPLQPIAVISRLGVMREQRERMARAAHALVNETVLSLHLIWDEPRIFIAGDAHALSDTSHNIECRLGTMRTGVVIDRRTNKLATSVEVSDFCVPSLLDKSSLRFQYSTHDGGEEITLYMRQTAAFFSPAEAERVLWALTHNLLCPKPAGGDTAADSSSPAASPTTDGAASSGAAEDQAPRPPMKRTLNIVIDGLVVGVFDPTGTNTHTLNLSNFKLRMTPTGDVTMTMHTLDLVEHFTNCSLMQSDNTAGVNAVEVIMTAAESTTQVTLSHMKMAVIPRGIGTLMNTLLSVQVPARVDGPARPTSTPAAAASAAPSPSESNRGKAITPASDTAALMPGRAAAPGSAKRASLLKATLKACSVSFMSSTTPVAEASLTNTSLSVETFEDKSSEMHVVLERFTVVDTMSPESIYRELITSTVEASSDKPEPTPSSSPAFVDFTLWSAPPLPDAAARDLEVIAPYYAKRLQCTVGCLSVVVIPEVTRAVMDVVSEVKVQVSEGNRGKAMNYMSDRAAAAVNLNQQLTELSIAIHKPQLYLVATPLATRDIQIYPGTLTIKSCMMEPGVTPPGCSAGGAIDGKLREVFMVEVEQMGLRLMGMDAFQRECRVQLRFQRSLHAPSLTTEDMLAAKKEPAASELLVCVPELVLELSREQTVYAFEVVGNLLGGEARGSAGASSLDDGSALPPPSTAAAAAPRRPPLSPASGAAAASTPSHEPPTAPPPTADDVPESVFHVHATVGKLVAGVAEIFQFTLSDLAYTAESHKSQSDINVTVAGLDLQHVGAQVETLDDAGRPTLTRVDELIDILKIEDVGMQVHRSISEIDWSQLSSSVDTSVTVNLASLKVGISPTTLFDTREVLYLPFCSKVLHIPIDPVPVLRLTEQRTVLEHDVALDNQHILLTSNRTLCCYELDLGGHRLILSGSPTAQIVLSAGCQLTITNGTVVIPGLYNIGSFVSFASSATLVTTSTCTLLREFQNIANSSFAFRQSMAAYQASLSSANRGGDANPPYVARGGAPPGQGQPAANELLTRHARLIASMQCKHMQVQMLSEEVTNFSSSLCMHTDVQFMQDSENDAPMRRNLAVQLLNLRSGEKEEHVLLPTDLIANVSGVDNVSVSIALKSLEFFTRTQLLRSLVEITKNFDTAFIEESTVTRSRPTVKFENTDATELVPVVTPGRCEHCNQHNAYLAANPNTPGTLCYRCCTGRDSLPATDLRVEIGYFDAILVGSSGDLLHGRIKNAFINLDPTMGIHVSLAATLYSFSNTAVMWEPFIESFQGTLLGNVTSNDYHLKMDRLDYVISPLNIRNLGLMSSDYATFTTAQKRLRKKFRAMAQRRAVAAFNGLPMYISEEEAQEAQRQIDLDNNQTNDDDVDLFLSTSHGTFGSKSIFGTLAATHNFDGGEGYTRDNPYAKINVTNYCNRTVYLESQPVLPRGCKLSYVTTKTTALFEREQRRGDPAADAMNSYIIDLSTPPLYSQSHDFVLEMKVVLTREAASRHLKRVVNVLVYPMHGTKTIISIENQLPFSLKNIGNLPLIKPKERFYLPPDVDLHKPLLVQVDATPDGQIYNPGTAANATSPPTIHDVLGGGSLTYICKSTTTANVVGACVESVQETMRAAVPCFNIIIGARLLLSNKLPYDVLVSPFPDPSGDITSGKTRHPTSSLPATLCASLARREVILGACAMEQTAFTLELRQPDSSNPEVYASAPFRVANGAAVTLRSPRGRAMVVKVILSANMIVLTTPFTLVNHTAIDLSLRQCDPNGEVKRVDMERNFSVLPANMNKSVAACPRNPAKDEFFVNVYSNNYFARSIPLHVQQRGLIILEEAPAGTVDAAAAARAAAKAKSAEKRGVVIHLAYTCRLDASGTLLVTFTPRWVIVNRSLLPLFVVPSNYAGMNAQEADAVASATVAAKRATKDAEVAPPSTPSTMQKEIDLCKAELMKLGGSSAVQLIDTSMALKVPSKGAVSLYRTPYCAPSVGYHMHVLQTLTSPLYGNPVEIETIHNEVIVAYKGSADGSSPAAGSPAASPDSPLAPARLDRFYEVSLVARDPYTYIILEEPQAAPYLFLNRTDKTIELRDTSKKSAGRLMARASPGYGTGLILDVGVTALVQVNVMDGDGTSPSLTFRFDLSRDMTPQEQASAPSGYQYRLSYSDDAQKMVEIFRTAGAGVVSRVVQGSPPAPIDVLMNMSLLTLSLVMPAKDIVFAAITDTRVSWSRHERKESLKFSIGNYQIDNQTEVSPRYVSCVLALRKSRSASAISGSIERTIVPSRGVLCFDEVRLDFAPTALRVSDTLLIAVFQFPRMISEAVAQPLPQHCPSARELFDTAPVQMDFMSTRVTLERFIINPIIVRVWLTRQVGEGDFFRENIHTREAALLSMMVPSCEDVSIVAPGIVSMKRQSRIGVLLQWLLESYKSGLLAQLQGLILQYASSLPFIGAPLKLASGFSSGAVRLFSDPIDGLSTSPMAFAQGLATGSAGFAQEFAGGGLGAFSNLFGTGARLLNMGGGVSESERRQQNTFSAIASGFKGIVQRPMEGQAESGATGLMKGIGNGLFGVVANPVAGVLSDVSKATGTLGKIITNKYIPETYRLRHIRDFFANGGVATWESIVTVYLYERVTSNRDVWSSAALMSTVDGPAWYPCRQEEATYGPSKKPIPLSSWVLDRYATNFDGWTFSTRYYGAYTNRKTPEVRTRRKRWTALVRPLPFSRVATHLRLNAGMLASPGVGSRTSSMDFDLQPPLGASGKAATTEDAVGAASAKPTMIQPGVLPVLSASEQKARSGSRGRSKTDFYATEDPVPQGRQRSPLRRTLTPMGRSVGVDQTLLRGHSAMADDSEGGDGAAPATNAEQFAQYSKLFAQDFQSPRAPPTGRMRRDRAASPPVTAKPAPGRKTTSGRSSRTSSADTTGEPSVLPTATVIGISSAPPTSRPPLLGRLETVATDTALRPMSGEAPAPALATGSPTLQTGRVVTPASAAPSAAAPARSTPPKGTPVAKPQSTDVEVYEYQRRVPLLGWGKRYLSSGCPAWQDARGQEAPARDDIKPPRNWQWRGGWVTVGGDRDGWTITPEDAQVRRRLWRRSLVENFPGSGSGTN